jgi:hypothetical protein
MDTFPTATYKGYDLYPLVYSNAIARERAWGERRPDRSYTAAVVLCREGAKPEGEQARTFRLDTTPWDNVGTARRAVLRYAEDIINGTVAAHSVATL